ncbi:unnamed protein product [Phyllotreta striolata]|uniref:Protein YIPF n=1 Tax=Phyllotreta striolata TaxID=444603 RepID=A0A9N9TIZ3_PHYSR|nr:unnamed protein product [Phyllotreta striolata]
MTNLQEVPTDELLNFQDFPSVHHTSDSNTTIPISQAQINVDNNVEGNLSRNENVQRTAEGIPNENGNQSEKAFWTLEYYQKYFDVDTADVIERIMASITPKWENTLKRHLREKPDLYGPFWISITLIFSIAISGNIANYLQHANSDYHWKYNFHAVSVAATVIFLYVVLVPFLLWGLLKWSIKPVQDIEGLDDELSPGILEIICVYGYSLFIYIPVSMLWFVQINWLQWGLLLFGTFVSGSVLLLTLTPSLRLSKHKFLISVGIVLFHLLMAMGFMMHFFQGSDDAVVPQPTVQPVVNTTKI